MKNFTFQVQADDLQTYPVTITFEDKLPSMTLRNEDGTEIGGKMGLEFRQHAFGIKSIMPRMRMTITLDCSSATGDPATYTPERGQQYRNLRASAPSIAAQVYVALQMVIACSK